MTTLTRRSLATGLAAAVAAIPAVKLCAAREDAYERIRRLTAELEEAMRVAYDSDDVRLLSWGPHNANDINGAGSPAVFIVAHLP
jgi:hypothetical protein